MRRRHIIFGPECDIAVIVAFSLPPSRESEQRFIEAVADEYVLQPVLVRMLQHSTKRIHTSAAVVLGVVKLRRAVSRQLRQQSSRVVTPIHASGVGIGRNFVELISKT